MPRSKKDLAKSSNKSKPLNALESSLRSLFRPVDGASLAFFRVTFYCVMLWESWRFYDKQWLSLYFSGQDFYFKFWPFDFVAPWPGEGMKIQLVVMAFCALCAGLGLFYRWSATAFFLMFTHFFLIEQARYLNHLYLVCLLAFLMIFVPAGRVFSLDNRRRKEGAHEVPAWAVWLLRFQVGVPYFFGGVAKLNDDWFRGEPLREWLSDRMDFPLLGQYFERESVVWTMNYGALVFDLGVVFLLLWRRTRILGFIAALGFHFMNSRLFGIGIFPWTMIVLTMIFFPPDWPRRFLSDLRSGHPWRSPLIGAGFVLGCLIGGWLPHNFSPARMLIGGLGMMVAAYYLDEPWRRRGAVAERDGDTAGWSWRGASRTERRLLAFLAVWVLIQVLLPLRHLWIPGNVHWTEEGHLYAWHMKLRDKGGLGLFIVSDPATGDSWRVRPDKLLTRTQNRKMLTRPVMIVQFAHYLESEFQEKEQRGDLEVRAEIRASLNGRPLKPFIDRTVDLTQVPYPWFGHADWILPLEPPTQ